MRDFDFEALGSKFYTKF